MKLSLRVCLLETKPGRLSGLAYGGDSIASRRGWDSYGSPEEQSRRARFKHGKDRYVVDPHWGRLMWIELDGKKHKSHASALEYLMQQGFDEEGAKQMLGQLPTEYLRRSDI